MKRIPVICMVLLFLFISANTVFALRCGDNLVSVGDLKNEVQLKCGEPKSREVIGYIDRVESETRIRVMKIEEWIVEVNYYGSIYYHSLVFEGNQLVEIKSAGEGKSK